MFPVSRYVIVFLLRKRVAVDYDEYVRKRREEFFRRQQQYYSQFGGYNNPYGRPPYQGGSYYAGTQTPYQNPNGQTAQQPQPPKNEDPFEEFSSKPTGEKTQENNGDSDGFFDWASAKGQLYE